MSTRIRIISAGLLTGLLLSLTLPAAAQRVPVNYTLISYYKVTPEHVDAFLSLMKDQSKKVAQVRISSGGIKSWSLLKLTVPFAAGSDHNYAVTTMGSTFPDLDPSGEAVNAVFNSAGVNRAEYLKKLRETGTLTGQSITRTVLRVGGVAAPGDFVRVDYHLNLGGVGELTDWEETIYAPMFKAVVDSGKSLKAWTTAVPVLPNGNELGYTLYTTQVYKDNASMGNGPGTSPEVFAKVHPQRNYVNVMERTRSLDKIVKVRIYHVLDTIGTPVMPSSN